MWLFFSILCTHMYLNTVLCQYYNDLSATLVSPSQLVLNEGRVEVSIGGEWGTICDTNWDIQDAHVVCRMLGFQGAMQAVPNGLFGTGINLAGKTVTQSSVSSGGNPGRAIDGNENANYPARSCTHTRKQNAPWWKVDLGVETCITKVEIRNRQDCCAYRLIDSIVRIGSNVNSSLNNQCGGVVTASQAGAGYLVTIRCSTPISGRYISVHGGRGIDIAILTICEFKAYESDLPCPVRNNFPSLDDDYRLVRLSNGTTKYNGRVEVYHHGYWGTICHRGWDISDANVLCRELGFQGAINAIPRSFFGAGNLNISLTNVQCSGEESSLLLCPHSGWGNHNCTMQDIASVSCHTLGTEINLQNMPVNQSSTSSGGVPSRATDGNDHPYYFANTCTHTRNDIAPWWRVDLQQEECISKVTIRNRAECCHERLIDTIVKVGSVDEVGDAVQCGLAVTATQALPGVWVHVMCARPIRGRYIFVQGGKGINRAMLTMCEVKVFKSDTPDEFCSDDTLVGPGVRITGTRIGKVEVYYQGEWGAICNVHWDLNDAEVVCRNLGLGRAKKVQRTSSSSMRRIWMTNVQCAGDEASIYYCPHDGWGNYDCTVDNLAWIECNSPLHEISLFGRNVRQSSVWQSNGNPERAIDGNTDGIWRSLSCTHTLNEKGPWWMVDMAEHHCISKVVLVNRQDCCHERLTNTIVRIGNNDTVANNHLCALPVTAEQASPGAFVQIECWQPMCGRYVSVHGGRGISEAMLTLCEVMVYATECEQQCTSDTVPFDDSIYIRLVHSNKSYEGTVEVYHDNSWGSICDQGWDENDAIVLCKQLGFETAIYALPRSFFGSNNNTVWLSNVQCTGHEESFFNCAHDGWGNYHTCGANHVAGVRCAIPKFEVQLLNKPTNQSSVSRGGDPGKAVDGDTDSDFYAGSCMQTNEWREEGPWWKVDLLEEHCITHVTIVNREDCCHDWLTDTIVRVGLNEDISLNSQCGNPISSEQALPGAWVRVNCIQPQCGRYVSIHGGRGTNKAILTMCEVKVHATECPTTCRLHQGPTDGNFVRLVDGASENEGRVEIYHHNEWRSVCGVGWGINAANVVCRELGFLSATNAMQGSQFGSGSESVWLSDVRCTGDEDSLSLCLHSDWRGDDCPDGHRAGIMSCGIVTTSISLEGLHAMQSSIADGGVPNRAIDGNTNPNAAAGSCIKTGGDRGWDTPAWWGIDFETTKCIARIDIRNRRDCCHERLINAIVLVGNSNDIYSDDLVTCGNPVNELQAQPGHWVTVSCNVPILGRYLFIAGGGGVQRSTLEICEVKVYEPAGYTELSSCTPPTESPASISQPSNRRLTTAITAAETRATKVINTTTEQNREELHCPSAELVSAISTFILTWRKTVVDTLIGSDQKCSEGSMRAGQPKAIRYCATDDNGIASWQDPVFLDCDDNATQMTAYLRNGSISPTISSLMLTQLMPWSGRIGSIVALIFLIITIGVLLIFTNFRESVAHMIQLNYCCSLLVFNLTFAIGINANDSRVACTVVAALLHFFMFANVTWLAVDLRHIYLVISHSIKENSSFMVKSCLIAWGIALLTAAVTLGVGFHQRENTRDICFISFGPDLFYGIILPVVLWLIYISYEAFVVIQTLRMRKHRSSETIDHFKAVQRFKSNLLLSSETVFLLAFLLSAVIKQSTTALVLFSVVNVILAISALVLYSCYQIESRNKLQSAIYRAQTPNTTNIGNEEMNANVNSVTVSGIANPLIDDDTKLEVELKHVSGENDGI
ncbi:scavenger receptor cysteine-rich type 1 protein M130-like isoform X2 [Amphiura filiformis]|uniref:scavenger receptor cysteine-rich type 1 protein M130-like isoform X2 n=1 Tax=Amphiura filiformis TaxID=82378 RepID=UPI003B20F2D1